jgi:hypothetical protein
MSWYFKFVGSKSAVKSYISKYIAHGDQSQLDAAKPLITGEIDAMPEPVRGVEVEASGHHDGHTRNLSIKINPVYLSLDSDGAQAAE